MEVDRLTHAFGDRIALDSLGFRVPSGEVYGILGPNGSGKSTLFKILSTVLRPVSGTVKVDGVDALKSPTQARRRLGVVFQSSSLDPRMTVMENMTAQGYLYGLSGADLRSRVVEVLNELGIEARRDDMAGSLSGGLKRRCEIGKAILHRPAVLLLDEASTGLDPVARREMWRALNALRAQEETTILFTTHLMDEAEAAGRLLLMNEGRSIKEGSPAELKRQFGSDVVLLRAASPALADLLRERFRVTAKLDGAEMRVEIQSGHRFIADVMEAFPNEVLAASLHKPTLEDVFLAETGRHLEDAHE